MPAILTIITQHDIDEFVAGRSCADEQHLITSASVDDERVRQAVAQATVLRGVLPDDANQIRATSQSARQLHGEHERREAETGNRRSK